jgi:hypothetical protein
MTYYDAFLTLREGGQVTFFCPKEDFIDVRFASEDNIGVDPDELMSPDMLDLQTPGFRPGGTRMGFFGADWRYGTPGHTHPSGFHSETIKSKPAVETQFGNNLGKREQSVESFEPMDHFDDQIMPIYASLRISLSNTQRPANDSLPLEKSPSEQPPSIAPRALNSPSKIIKLRGISSGNVYSGTSSDRLCLSGRNQTTSSKTPSASSGFNPNAQPKPFVMPRPVPVTRQNEILLFLDTRIEAISAKIKPKNIAHLTPFLQQFEQIRQLVMANPDLTPIQIDTVQKVVSDICAALKICKTTVSTFNYDSEITQKSGVSKPVYLNDRYQKRSNSNISRSVDSHQSDNSPSHFHRYRSRIPKDPSNSGVNDSNLPLSQPILKKNTNSINEGLEPLSKTVKRNLVESTTYELSSPTLQCVVTPTRFKQPLFAHMKPPSQPASGLAFCLLFLIQRRHRRDRKDSLESLKRHGKNIENIKLTREFFKNFFKKCIFFCLKKLRFFQRRKTTILRELLLQSTKSHKRLLKEVVWVLRNKTDRSFTKLSSVLASDRFTNSCAFLQQDHFAVSPRQIKRDLRGKQTVNFSRSTNHATIDEVRQTEADSFFLDLEREYNTSYGRDLEFLQKPPKGNA